MALAMAAAGLLVQPRPLLSGLGVGGGGGGGKAVCGAGLHFSVAFLQRGRGSLGGAEVCAHAVQSGKCCAKVSGRRSSEPSFEDEEMNDFINPANFEPPEVEDEEERLTKFEKVSREAGRMRQKQEEKYAGMKPVFLKAIGLDEDGNEAGGRREDENEQQAREIVRVRDLDEETYAAVKESVADRRVKPRPSVFGAVDDAEEDDDVLEDVVLAEEDLLEDEDLDLTRTVSLDPSFELNFEADDVEEEDIPEPMYKTALGELLDEAKVTPLSVEGDLDAEVTGIQHDSREVNPGDMFVCCTGFNEDGHNFAAQAVERGASVIVATNQVSVSDSVKALVIVENTNAILSALAGAFYMHPSQKLAVVGITGTNGKTTTSYLLRSMYECMGLRTGLLGTINYYISSKKKLEAPNTTPDGVYLQKLMASMVHYGTKVCVMEVSSHALSLDRCKDVDFDVAVFTNLTRDHMDFHKTAEEYKMAKGKLFAKMVDPSRHRKVVNVDDPNATYFISQGSPDVPVVTFGQQNSGADVYPLEVQLSLFETELLVRTPKGNVEISSGLLGRHNVYNILAAVAVGISVGVPLEAIVRGIEEVDAVPGRCELIDEEQAFAVVVDYAHTPDALSRLLDTVRECGPRRIITVVGCGGDRDRGKRPMMAKIATDKSEVTILTSDNPRTEDPLDIIDDMLAGVGWSIEEYCEWGDKDYYPPLPNGHRLFVYDIRCIAVRAAVAMGEEGDAVVIAGKGHETYQIIGKEKKYFDDREECREALQHVDALHAAGVDTSEFPWRVPESTL